jgi:DNA mismatch repair protein PMS2
MVTKLGSDLFIIDQHACDEKYQFETMQATTKLHSQRMVVPQPMEVNVAGELVVLEHLDIMGANGFEFDVDENAPAGRRLSLKSVPMSKSVTFGTEDVYRPCLLPRGDELTGIFHAVGHDMHCVMQYAAGLN